MADRHGPTGILTPTPALPILAAMFFLSFVTDRVGGNGAKAYQCIGCGGLITHSDQLLAVEGRVRHSFVNPSGIEYEFQTFSSCPGAIALGEASEAYTWFAGYRWRIALCRNCGLHMGWHYQAALRSDRPRGFWGVLVSSVVTG